MLVVLVLSAKGGQLKAEADNEEIDWKDVGEDEMLNDVDETGHNFEKYSDEDGSHDEEDGDDNHHDGHDHTHDDSGFDDSGFDADDVGKHNEHGEHDSEEEAEYLVNDIGESGLDNSEFTADDVVHVGGGDQVNDQYIPDEEEE
ncbi:hypothetical protein SprV_0702394900 [Sparganum proliferum]